MGSNEREIVRGDKIQEGILENSLQNLINLLEIELGKRLSYSLSAAAIKTV